MIPIVLAQGKYDAGKYKDRVYFIYGNYRATVRLNWDGQKRIWLVTNFEDKKIKASNDADAFLLMVRFLHQRGSLLLILI